MNTSYFSIEKSIDGTHFAPIGLPVKAAGNSLTKRTYTYYDRNIRETMVFYRIRLYDIDTSSRLSNTIVLRLQKNEKINVFPNPVGPVVNIEFRNIGRYDIHLLGYNGQLVKKLNNIRINTGDRYVILKRGNLPEGTYVLRIYNQHSGQIHHFKLILLKE